MLDRTKPTVLVVEASRGVVDEVDRSPGDWVASPDPTTAEYKTKICVIKAVSFMQDYIQASMQYRTTIAQYY